MELKNADGKDKWWVIVLKAIAYIIGLIIGGIGTTQAAVLLSQL